MLCKGIPQILKRERVIKMRTRKTDKWRLKEGHGMGVGMNYKPWIKIHEFGSDGHMRTVSIDSDRTNTSDCR